jgi:antitoxin (DNA-binding transcriptional repressor) of toxin-antitoxin stability system
MIQIDLDKIIAFEDLPGRLSQVIDEAHNGAIFVVTKEDRPAVAIVSIDQLEGLSGRKVVTPLSETPSEESAAPPPPEPTPPPTTPPPSESAPLPPPPSVASSGPLPPASPTPDTSPPPAPRVPPASSPPAEEADKPLDEMPL